MRCMNGISPRQIAVHILMSLVNKHACILSHNISHLHQSQSHQPSLATQSPQPSATQSHQSSSVTQSHQPSSVTQSHQPSSVTQFQLHCNPTSYYEPSTKLKPLPHEMLLHKSSSLRSWFKKKKKEDKNKHHINENSCLNNSHLILHSLPEIKGKDEIVWLRDHWNSNTTLVLTLLRLKPFQ